MIGTYPVSTHLLGQSAVWGCSILGCCCLFVDEFGGTTFPQSGRPQPPAPAEPDRPIDTTENPFLSFQPVATPADEAVIDSPSDRDASRGTLPESGTAERPLKGPSEPRPADDGELEEALREAFQLYLMREEEDFLALLLAAEDEDCCCVAC